MAELKFINRPIKTDRSSYNEAIKSICNYLIKKDGIKAIYQFGNITTPGISDIDLLVVAQDNIKLEFNGFEEYPTHLKHLFTHGIMALPECYFGLNDYYSAWSDKTLILGEKITVNNLPKITDAETSAIKHQVALEFILMNYINLKIQLTYGTIKLRSLLQHLKGIQYDLLFLNIKESSLNPLIEQLKKWILNWFEETPSDHELSKFIIKFDETYEQFVKNIFLKEELFMPSNQSIQVSKNIKLINSEIIGFNRNGILLPVFLSKHLGLKSAKVQNKLNSFTFQVPYTNKCSNLIIENRITFLRKMKQYNNENLPNFSTLTSSLTANII